MANKVPTSAVKALMSSSAMELKAFLASSWSATTAALAPNFVTLLASHLQTSL